MSTKSIRIAFAIMLLIFGALTTACGSSSANAISKNGNVTCVEGNLQITGSTALQPLVRDAATNYQALCQGANITVGGGGSSSGLKNAQDGGSQIGNSDVFAKKARYPNLVDHQVAVVTFSVVINDKVSKINNLTSQQLQGIYSGKIKNWKELGGPDLAIVAISRPAGSGTRLTFEQYILQGKETITGNPVANASGEVATSITQTDGAISYIASDFARKNELKIVKINGIEETIANVKDNTYTFWNIEHMYTKGKASGLTDAFIRYMQSPDIEAFRKKQGFLDITQISQSAIQAKTPKSNQ